MRTVRFPTQDCKSPVPYDDNHQASRAHKVDEGIAIRGCLRRLHNVDGPISKTPCPQHPGKKPSAVEFVALYVRLCTVIYVAYLRIGTLNLWGDPHERLERLEIVSKWVCAEDIDVLAVQEVTSLENGTTATHLCDLSGFHHATPVATSDGSMSSCAVLTRRELDAGKSELLLLPGLTAPGEKMFAAVCHIPVAGVYLPVASTHLAWGSLREAERLDQAKTLVHYFDTLLDASESESPAVLCGDMNAWSDSDSVRYLGGRTAFEPATLWTDAWDHALDPSDNGATSSGLNPYAIRTALNMRTGPDAVLDATLLPDRRIDYIFSRGWRHGRVFSPTSTRVVRDPLMSDHYAVVTDLIIN